jgi:hypothetical protein
MHPSQQMDQILDALVRDVESSVHAFYRGDVRQHTQRVKTDTFRNAARSALAPLLRADDGAPGAVESAASAPTSGSAAALAPDEVAAGMRCVTGWLPMGPPSAASPASRCVSAARELAPTWGEREKARLALKRLSS